MREYRRYTNIKWGPLYNPESGAHHVFAKDVDEACKLLPLGSDGLQGTQVRSGDKWCWVTEMPTYLGGVSGKYGD